MAGYVYGTSLSYWDYLQADEFRKEVTGASQEAGRVVSMEVSRQTREIIATQECLAREQIESNRDIARELTEARREATRQQVEALGEVNKTLEGGFETLSYRLSDISSGIADLEATFHWGFSRMIAQIGHMNDTLTELVKIAKTPVQTVAFNHFEISRDAFRQGLYREALEELGKAVEGDHTSPGYKLEWRFHHLRGVIRLGFVDGDMELVDLAEAERAFLAAARYAKNDYPEDAGRAFLSAGWAAYCQGKMPEALNHTEQAVKVHPGLGEAFFQASKVLMAMNNPENALPYLGKAVEHDIFFALKASGDGDFKRHEEALRDFLEVLRREKLRRVVSQVTEVMKAITDGGRCAAVTPEMIKRIEQFHKEGDSWPLMDVAQFGTDLDDALAGTWSMIKEVPSLKVMITKSCSEQVVVRPAGFLRKALYREETRTRQVPKDVPLELHEIGSLGKPIVSVEFIRIPAGQFIMGEGLNCHQVRIGQDFMLGRYPVTQAQWNAVMGNNPSHSQGHNHPVEQVSWEDAQRFIAKLNGIGGKLYRLPTEAEWEYACRAGTTTNFYFGDDENLLDKYAWFNKNSGDTTHPVGQKLPNAWGLYDMHGNVLEWCEDWYGDYPSGAVTDPVGPSSGSIRVLRGGCWFSDPVSCRSAYRSRSTPESRYYDLGFRLALPAVQ